MKNAPNLDKAEVISPSALDNDISGGGFGRKWRLCRWIVAATCVKLLLLSPNTYHSTDFEVHRNWMALTSSMPACKWYWDELSQWTLDYPPLFAGFEKVLGDTAYHILGSDASSRMLSRTPDDSRTTVLFQRGSVIVSDILLFFGLESVGSALGWTNDLADSVGALIFLNAGLLLVDHIHFQYNGMLLGVLLLSIGLTLQRKYICGGVVFAFLLMLKHLFLSLAPLYFVYLLRVCWWEINSDTLRSSRVVTPRSLWRLMSLGLAVISVFFFCLWPLCWSERCNNDNDCRRQLVQLAKRLFPVSRGLLHEFWAPNSWALYMAADRFMLQAMKLMDRAFMMVSSTGLLLVRDAKPNPSVFPSITPIGSAMATLVFQVPALFRAWQKPEPRVFMWSVVLVTIIPLAILGAWDHKSAAHLYLRVVAAGHAGLLPLFPNVEDVLVKIVLVAAHLSLSWVVLNVPLKILDIIQLCSLGMIVFFADVIHPLVLGGEHGHLPFLPLMATSVVCACWLVLCWVGCLYQIMRRMSSSALIHDKKRN